MSLVVMSMIKQKLKAEGMNTSQEVFEALTDLIEFLLKAAVINAKEDKRKTVMARDIGAATLLVHTVTK